MRHTLFAFVFTLLVVPGGAHALSLAPERIDAEPVFCPAIYQPVCGLVEVQCITAPCPPVEETFSNRCELGARGAKFLHEGVCKVDGGDHGETNPNTKIPSSCRVWFDGCNTCSRDRIGGPMACTLRACLDAPGKAYCRAHFDDHDKKEEDTDLDDDFFEDFEREFDSFDDLFNFDFDTDIAIEAETDIEALEEDIDAIADELNDIDLTLDTDFEEHDGSRSSTFKLFADDRADREARATATFDFLLAVPRFFSNLLFSFF